jgi:hypothetical protein
VKSLHVRGLKAFERLPRRVYHLVAQFQCAVWAVPNSFKRTVRRGTFNPCGQVCGSPGRNACLIDSERMADEMIPERFDALVQQRTISGKIKVAEL